MAAIKNNIARIYRHYGVLPARAAHSLGVAKIASELARMHGVNPETAWLAGALHDIARDWNESKIRNYCDSHDIELNRDESLNYLLIHGKVAAKICELELGIVNPDALAAIRHHTSGKADMSPLEMIIYTSDTLESIKELPIYPEVWEVISHSLPAGVAMVNDLTAKHHLSLGHNLNQEFLNNCACYNK